MYGIDRDTGWALVHVNQCSTFLVLNILWKNDSLLTKKLRCWPLEGLYVIYKNPHI